MISSNIVWHKYVWIKHFENTYTRIAVDVPGSFKNYVSLTWVGFYACLCFKALRTHALESSRFWQSEGYCLVYMFTLAWNNVVSQAECVKAGESTHKTKLYVVFCKYKTCSGRSLSGRTYQTCNTSLWFSCSRSFRSRFRSVKAKKVTNVLVYWLCALIIATVIPTFLMETEKLF